MQYKTQRFSGKRRPGQKEERGVALLASLLLLLLMTGLSVAMVMSVRSDLLVNGYYRNFRGSFYAADSGLNIARASIVNQIAADLATLGPGYNPATTVPLSTTEDTAIQSLITSSYGASFHSVNTGNANNSWPEAYKITNFTFTYSNCTPLYSTAVSSPGTCPAPSGAPSGYRYIFNYSMTAVGQAAGNESTTLVDNGNVFVNATGAGASTLTNFAAFGMFIDQYSICSGGVLVPGTISGPVFTNGSWNFGTSGKYIFTDPVGQNGADAGYQFSGSCDQVAGPSDVKGGTTIAPTFQNGFQLNQPKVPLPTNQYNQEQAVLDGLGITGTGSASSPPSKQNLNNALRDVTGTPYPKNGASAGVFLPYTVDSNGKNPTFSGGGIYVEGNAQVTLTPGANGTAQIYTIVQNGVTTTVTVDGGGKTDGTGTTTITTGGLTQIINGVPVLKDPATQNVTGDDTMLYVNGNITGLSGPGEGVPAIQDHTALTITAAGNVNITGDILYKKEPVTLTQTQITDPVTGLTTTLPADTLLPNNNTGQALGIFTATGNINLQNSQSDGNLQIDASMATISQGGSGGIVNTGSAINTLTIVGGRIQNTIQNINTTTRNVFFDRRFGQGFAPPWFPSTNVTIAPGTPTTFTTSISRTQWVNASSYN